MTKLQPGQIPLINGQIPLIYGQVTAWTNPWIYPLMYGQGTAWTNQSLAIATKWDFAS